MTTTCAATPEPGSARTDAGGPGELLYESDRTRVRRVRLAGGTGSVVVKEPRGAGSVRRLRRELATLQRLAGIDGVPQLSAVRAGAGAVTTEDVGGAPVSALLSAGPLGVPELLELAIDLVGVVAAVHRRGVVHKDINPANILIRDRSPRAVLIDFDLATTAAGERPGFSHQNEIAGTLAFLAPEQTGRTARPVDRRADLYALGATLYALATGAPPFGDGEGLQLIHDHLARLPAPAAHRNPALPQALSDIIARLLEKEPDLRYQSAEGLGHDLCRLRDAQIDESRHRDVRPAGHSDVVAGAGQRHAVAFTLGERDFPARLSAPSRLVGRDREIDVLRTALSGALAGSNRGLLVAGAPGVGKTALIDELRPIVTSRGGWFVAGKFDQYRRDGSIDAVRQALGALCRLLLAGSEADVAAQRQRIIAGLGPNAGLVAAVVPEFAVLLGVAPEVPTDDPVTAERRMVGAALDLLRSVASPERPVALVLDDLRC